MSINKNGLKNALLQSMSGNPTNKDDALDAMAEALVNYLKDNLEVKVPTGAFVTNATGQVVATKNTTPLSCEVS